MGGNEILCHLVRCVFGTPWRRSVVEPPGRTAEAVALARSIYTERRFAGLPDMS